MAEQTFRSPNFYEREIDISGPTASEPTGTPAGVIGAANKGPAFVPITVGNFNEFVSNFGSLDPKIYGPYAVNEFLKNRSALTYLRVLGAGANSTDADITTTLLKGRVKNAGFKLEGNSDPNTNGRHNGVVQFLTAKHVVQDSESLGIPMFSDNDSYTPGPVFYANMVRGVILTPSSSRVMVLGGNDSAIGAFTGNNVDVGVLNASGEFKIAISSSLGNSFWNSDNNPGVKIFTASLNPTSANYFYKILNTDPDRFVEDQHLVYLDFPVDNEIAVASIAGILSGSTKTSTSSGDTALTMREAFGAYDTRYKAPATSWFISQPFGATEYDLFKFEAIDDGEYANSLYKISITNLKASLNDADPYCTFTVQIRDWSDTDTDQRVLESFNNCSLNPQAENFIGKVIGDRKVSYNFDTTIDAEKRLIVTGKYPNVSRTVRVVVSDAVERGLVPAKSMPFGFRGMSLLKTTDSLTDSPTSEQRILGVFGSDESTSMSGSILPPIPFRFKITRGDVPTTFTWSGDAGPTEIAVSSYYWGVKFERNTTPKNPNPISEKNNLLKSFSKFMGIEKLDVLVTGSGADTFNNNKFSLSKVAFSNGSITQLTSSVNDHMKTAAYIRNAVLDPTDYTYDDPDFGEKRITFATLLAKASAPEFNKFSQYAKFTTFMCGGFDGTNILDKNSRRLNDRSVSFDDGGAASPTYLSPGFSTNFNGSGQDNNNVASYVKAVDIMTDSFVVGTNIFAMPGIRDGFLTEYAMKKVRDYGLAYYVMDIPSYDDNGNRMFDDSTARANVDETASALDSRAIDNNYVGTYWPDVYVDDATNRRRVKVPASVAAMGAIAFNDRVSYPWFAPAGFNRAALDFVTNVAVRLNVSDRDRLYESRINPIATFPRLGFVIYGQKTLQVNKSALDRVNVRRLLLEVKRSIIGIAQRIVFEQNTPEVRNKFVADAVLQLGLIQTQAGIEAFQVVMNETNNTQEDVDLNRLNGRIVIVPTRVIEYIQIDFIITNSGVQFV